METLLLILTASLTITEVCSNPPDETSGEFVEFFNDSTAPLNTTGFTITDGDALDELLPWSGAFPQSDVQTGTALIPAGGYAVLLEEGYLNDPWLIFEPGTVILTTGDQSICNGLAASSDPLTLFNGTGTGLSSVVSTFGTPFQSENWNERDDDGLDSIPFDPGESLSLFRYPVNMPDCEAAWYSSSPTPGSPPDAPPDTFFITIDTLSISDLNPDPGSGVTLTAVISCWGTVSPGTGTVFLYLDVNGDSAVQVSEELISFPASQLLPGSSDTLEVFFTVPEKGWYPAVCSAPECEERLHFRTGGGVDPVITEVMANPENEDTEEFIEVWYQGPGVFPLQGCAFTDGDAVDIVTSVENGGYIRPEHPAVIIDPEYTGTLSIPPETPLFVPANTTLGNGLTTDDPVLLYRTSEPSLETLVATAGTPLLYDDPLSCDDDGLDSIPFDPGNGRSMERIFPEGPDRQYNWAVSEPGGTPGVVQEGQNCTDLAADSLVFAETIRAYFSNCGSSGASGTASIFSDLNGDLFPDPDELLHAAVLTIEPGEQDSLVIPWSPPDSGLFILAAAIEAQEDTTASNNMKYMQYIPESPAWPVITEVLCNPSDEDRDEFIELFFAGPGLADITMFTFTDGDSQDEIVTADSPFLTAEGYCLILDPEYAGGYDIPPGTPVFNSGNTTLGDGLSGSDPVILLTDSTEISTYGTPWNETDDIPFDPGTDLSVERIAAHLPDLQGNWYSSLSGPTPGTGPQGIVQGIDYALSAISVRPPMGPENTETTVSVSVTCLGTDSAAAGNLAAQFQGSQPVPLPIPALGDTATAYFNWISSGDTELLEAVLICSEDKRPENDRDTLCWNQPPGVVINEIFYNEPEWIELYNGTDYPVNLSSLTLADLSTEAVLPDFILSPEQFAVVTCNEDDFTAAWGIPPCEVLEPDDWPSLNNSGDSLLLFNSCSTLDMVPYSSQWGGSDVSTLERRSSEQFGFLEENWSSCISTGTPGEPNSIGEKENGDFLQVSPVIFNSPETPLKITVNLPQQACNVTVRIYDVRGMELEKLFDSIVPGETLTLTWAGEDYPVGRYIVSAEASCSGVHLGDAVVVVLARPLG